MSIKFVASIAPNKIYPRHSEGSFIRLKNGSLAFFYSRFHGGSADDSPSDIVMLSSFDEGESWGEARQIISASEHGVKNIMSVSALRMQNGDLGVIYLVKENDGCSTPTLALSRDEGASFYKKIKIVGDNARAYYVVNNDRILRLNSGRLVLPLTFHRSSETDDASKRRYDYRGVAVFYLSDDDGITWREARDIVFAPFAHTYSGLQENGAIEIRPGLIMGYSRTDKGCQYVYYSFDDGESWTEAMPSSFTSPCSPLHIRLNKFNNKFYAVYNPIADAGELKSGNERCPLIYKESSDGLNWANAKIIEGDPEHCYCYPAIYFVSANKMLVAYCAGLTQSEGGLSRTNIALIDI